MKVWFHTTREMNSEEEEIDYDTYTDSRLFASAAACTNDADSEIQQERERNAERYHKEVERYEQQLGALDVLQNNNINIEAAGFRIPNTPKFWEPYPRFIYSLDVEE